MAKVTNIKIKPQTGNTETLMATWEFSAATTTTSSGAIKNGSLVSIKQDATYYNGAAMDAGVKKTRWYLRELAGDRAVLGISEDGKTNLGLPVNTKYLLSASGASSAVVSVSTLDHYTVAWYYDSGDGIWFSGDSSDTTNKYSLYTPPSNALNVRVSIKPVAKTYKVNNKDTYYWTGTSTSLNYSTSVMPPEKPQVPTVETDKYNLTATIKNITDAKTDQIEFQVYNGDVLFKTGVASVITAQAIFTCPVSAGGSYRVRCRAVNLYGNSKNYSDWSDYSDDAITIPSQPAKIIVCRAASETSIYLEWIKSVNAEKYVIQYSTKKDSFDGNGETTTAPETEFNYQTIIGLETGEEYFFRVRAINSKGNSAWSGIASAIIGTKPSPPTTWSSTTTIVIGEPMNLYWVHNSVDGSKQTKAEIEIVRWFYSHSETKNIEIDTSEDDEDKTYVYSIDSQGYKESLSISWRVRTAGVTGEYSEYSVTRKVLIYAPPTLELKVTDSNGDAITDLTSFPINVTAKAGPTPHTPTGYHIDVTANEGYTALDYLGNKTLVNAGDTVYSKFFDTKEQLKILLSASDLDLENNIEYKITCTVSLDSGLTAEASSTFTVSWSDVQYYIDAEIAIDHDSAVAYISPYCKNSDYTLVSGILLSVYRLDSDGGFTEIVKNIDNYKGTTITDPHPALNYARYRIVAMDKNTGAISYYDTPAYPVGEKAIIIQWDEEWSNFNVSNEDEYAQPPWNGSLLRLPYDIDVSESSKTDVELVKYIGRNYPVAYYGTSIDTSQTWNTNIERDDEETIYALRRLSKWFGNVYVREPSGNGYWARIEVSFSQKHCELTIPVTLTITRVEGGA